MTLTLRSYSINNVYFKGYLHITFQVSNRLPFVLCRRKKLEGDELQSLYRKPSAGGLVTAVAPVMVQSGGRGIT